MQERMSIPSDNHSAESFHEDEFRKESFVPPRLLLVDDEPRIVDKLALLLQREGFEAQVAYNGRQAVDAALSSQPDVFILDIGMLDIDGYKLARQLRTTMNCEGRSSLP